MGCRMQQRVVVVVLLQAQAAEALPRLRQILLQPVRQAVERGDRPYLAAPARRVDRPVAEVVVPDLEILDLPIFPTPQAGSEELLLAWRCKADKARLLLAGRCSPETASVRPLDPRRLQRSRPHP